MPDKIINSTCGYCSTGCNLTVTIKEDGKKSVKANPVYSVNQGKVCPKGYHFLVPLEAEDRGIQPLERRSRDRAPEPVSWNQAMEAFESHFKEIQNKYGKSSVAFLSTGQIPTEEMALLGALSKFGMGLLHGDGNTRQCMATAARAYKESFGFDAPPFSYQDFEESNTLIFIGSNVVINHPIMWQRVLKNKNNPTIIVIDPRKTETAQKAQEHYQINPKSDLIFLYALAHELIANDWIDKEFIQSNTEEFADFRHHVQAITPEMAAEISGISAEKIQHLARQIHEGGKVSFWWTMGVNQSHQGVRTAQAIINLALMTHNIGKPGTGANSITGQANAMGSRLYSNTTCLFGGRDFTDSKHRKEVAEILDIPEEVIPQENSWAYDQILEAIDTGKIKGLWVIATNPAHTWIHKNQFYDRIKKLDYLVVQDMYYSTETARLADLYLPAGGTGEKNGFFINSERRLGIIQKIADPPGDAKTDFEIFKMIAKQWGCEEMFRQWESPEAVFQILKKLSKGRPCDITGIENYGMLDQSGGIQWPFPMGSVLVEQRRLFEDNSFFTHTGKAKFCYSPSRDLPEIADKEYPVTLLSGRGSVVQFHTQTRTGKVPILRAKYSQEIYAEINPEDALEWKMETDQWVRISSRRGSLEAKVLVKDSVMRNHIFIPMHYSEVNYLTFPSFDEFSRQPSYKMGAVKVEALS